MYFCFTKKDNLNTASESVEFAWLLFAIVSCMIQGSQLNLISTSSVQAQSDRYQPIQPSTPPPPSAPLNITPPVQTQHGGVPTGDFQAFNFVDPLNLTPRYKLLCEQVLFRNADALLYYFGFQVDNVKGQVEHVLMLLSNYSRFIHRISFCVTLLSLSLSLTISVLSLLLPNLLPPPPSSSLLIDPNRKVPSICCILKYSKITDNGVAISKCPHSSRPRPTQTTTATLAGNPSIYYYGSSSGVRPPI